MLSSVFVSHGSPMLALDAGAVGHIWRRAVPAKPAAIVMMSAHWESSRPLLASAKRLATIHDFGGFPEALYRIEYPAHGSPLIAEHAADLLMQAGFDVAFDAQRGLDHGAWVPLREMYADASVPIVQLSLQPQLGPAHHYRLGRALMSLARDNVLLVGSGSLTHNLHEAFAAMRSSVPLPALSYVREFQQWMYAALQRGDIESLLSYRAAAPHAQRAHPTEEHLLPLFFALGAAGDGAKATRDYDAVELSSLAMDVYRFTAP